LRNIALKAEVGTVYTYDVTVQLGADNVYDHTRIYKYTVVVGNAQYSGVTSYHFGVSTTDDVRIWIYPQRIYSDYGESKIIVVVPGESRPQEYTVGWEGQYLPNMLFGEEPKDGELDTRKDYDVKTFSKEGKYRVYVVSADAEYRDGIIIGGDTYFVEGFEIGASANSMSSIVLFVIIGVLGVGVILFIRIRMSLKVR